MRCEFCNTLFSNKSNLNAHQKTTKYCLKLRKIIEEKEREPFECEFCEKIYCRKDYLKKHQLKCEGKLKIEYDNLKEKLEEKEKELIKIESEKNKEINGVLLDRIEDLKNCNTKMAEIAKIPNVINNNTITNTTTTNTDNSKKINNVLNLMSPSDILSNPEKIRKIFQDNYRTKHLMRGVEGLASFSIEFILKTPDGKVCYMCTDPSRKTFLAMNSDGSVNKDIECYNLIDMIYKPANEESERLYRNIKDNHDELETQLEEEIEQGNIKEYDENYCQIKELIRIEKQRQDFAYRRRGEIQTLKDENKGKFIKSLSIPLNNSINLKKDEIKK